MITPIEIFDTIAKVGIGSIITATTALFIIKRKNKLDNVTLGSHRKIEKYEDISKKVGSVNHIFSKYSALAIESTRYGDKWPEARKAELNLITNELVQAYADLSEAESTLLLLGEKRMEKALKLYSAKIAHFRKEVYIGRENMSEDQIRTIKEDIATLKNQFYDILSLRYDRALND